MVLALLSMTMFVAMLGATLIALRDEQRAARDDEARHDILR